MVVLEGVAVAFRCYLSQQRLDRPLAPTDCGVGREEDPSCRHRRVVVRQVHQVHQVRSTTRSTRSSAGWLLHRRPRWFEGSHVVTLHVNSMGPFSLPVRAHRILELPVNRVCFQKEPRD